MAASAKLMLEGGCNFRELGGYPTADGRRVRTGQLYRSGVLSYLTAADQQRLGELGISAICDLRHAQERSSEPTRWGHGKVHMLTWDDPLDLATVGAFADISSPDQARAKMLTLYRNMPEWLAPRLRGLFRYLVCKPGPVLFHCSAGKDRTGLTAALLLSMLGVSAEQVMVDYLATNEETDLEAFISRQRRANLGVASLNHPIFTVPEAARRQLFRADPDYLEAALAVIYNRPGGMQGYISRYLGLDPSMRATLAARLLE